MPVLTVIAGPNGSGKSTLTKAFDFEGRENLLDPDAIARRMDPADPRRMQVAAAREVLRRTQSCLEKRVSFAVETTLAGKRTLETMRNAKALGFTVQVVYVCLNTPERCVLRVRERALQGGHDVPDEDIRRRYHRSLFNLAEAIRIADRMIIFDNSHDQRRKMLELEGGFIVWRAVNEPDWIAKLRDLLH